VATVPHGMGELDAIHGARDLDVGEHDREIMADPQDGDRLIRMGGLDGLKPSVLDEVNRIQQRLVLYDRNDCLGCGGAF
jgi:hypothetical protein